MARKIPREESTEELADTLEPGEGPVRGKFRQEKTETPNKGRMSDKTQDSDRGVEAVDYEYDDDGFDIETTEDESIEMAKEAHRLAKGDGADDGIEEPGSTY